METNNIKNQHPERDMFVAFVGQLAPEGCTPLVGEQFFKEDGEVGYKVVDTLRPGVANYISIGCFVKDRVDEKGKLRARAENADSVLMMMLDDIGTKSKVPPLEPSWKIETSPGNFQWGYVFSERPTKDEFKAAYKAIADAGYTDPSANNPIRWCRIPGSVNMKPEKAGFVSRLAEFYPNRRFTLADLCSGLDVVPAEMSRPARPESALPPPSIDEVEEMLKFISAKDRVIYIKVGMAIHRTYGDTGFDTWDQWAQTCPEEYNEKDAIKDWESFRDKKNRPVTLGTLKYYAREGGYISDSHDFDVGELFNVPPDQPETNQPGQQLPKPVNPSEIFITETFASHGLDAARYRAVVAPLQHPEGAFALKMGERVVEYHKGVGRVRASGQVAPVFFGDLKENPIFVTDDWFSAAALHEATGKSVICVEGWTFGEIQSEDGESSRDLHTDLLGIVRPNLQLRVITTVHQDDMRLRMATFRMLMMDEGVNVRVFALPLVDFQPVSGFGDWAMKTWVSRDAWPTGDGLIKAMFGKNGAMQRVADDDLADAAKSYTMSNADRFGKFHLDLTDRGAGSYILSKLGRGNFYHLADRGEWVQWKAGAWRSIGKDPLVLINVAAHGYLQRAEVLMKQADKTRAEAEKLKNEAARTALKEEANEKKITAKAFISRAHTLSSTSGRMNVLKDLMGRTEVAKLSGEFDTDRWLLGVKNGILDLRTGIVREARQEDMMFRSCRVRYIKGAQHPKITKVLREITAVAYVKDAPAWMGMTDGYALAPEREQWLQRRLGAAMVGGNTLTSLEILYGAGSNGKSVIAKMLLGVFGQAGTAIGETGYAITVPASAIMSTYHAKDPNAATPYLAATVGARFLLMIESKDTDKLNEQLVKNVTGGDEVAYRALYKGAAKFTPQFTPILFTNPLPQITEGGKAIWDRLAPMNLMMRWARPGAEDAEKETLPPEDTWFRDDADKDDAACEAFLAWLVEGCLAWQKSGLGEMPADVKASLNSYRESSDVYGLWAEDCKVVFKKGCFASSQSIYDSFSMWMRKNGNQVPSITVVIKRLLEQYPELDKGKSSDIRGVFGLMVPPTPSLLTGFSTLSGVGDVSRM